jgi:DNA-directed RNA polymerase specialized sigma24 family protein
VLGGGSQHDETAIARVYGAAVAAAADADAAEEATLRVFAAAGAAERDPETLAATAVRLALRAAPDPAFASMEVEDRDAVALARLLRWPEPRIAAALDIDIPEVRRRLTRGLRAALTAAACV